MRESKEMLNNLTLEQISKIKGCKNNDGTAWTAF